jgi:hypothetical protein
MDDADRSGPNGRGDEKTGRTAAIDLVRIGQEGLSKKLTDSAKTLKFWVQLAAGISIGLFLAGAWVMRMWAGVAHVEQLDAVRERVSHVEEGMIIIGVKVDGLGSDSRWSRDQLLEIARTVRAPMVVQPAPPLLPPTPVAAPEHK